MIKHDGKVSIGGRTTNNLLFADDINALTEEEQKLNSNGKSQKYLHKV